MKLLSFVIVSFALGACQSTPNAGDSNKYASIESSLPERFIAVKDFKTLDLSRIEDFKLPLQQDTKDLVTHLFFGYLDQVGTDVIFVPTENIPYLEGRLYGWALKYGIQNEGPKDSRPVLYEEMLLPDSPRVLRVNQETTQIKNNGKLIITKLPLKAKENWAFNFWEITEEDPEGEYQFTIKLKDKLISKKSIHLKR